MNLSSKEINCLEKINVQIGIAYGIALLVLLFLVYLYLQFGNH
jgi:hypothetical protein